MPQTGTLAALKLLFASGRRAVAADTILTPADIGRLIVVDTGGADVDITLPAITGSAGVNGIGEGGAIGIIVTDGANSCNVQSQGGTPDTFNGGQAFAPLVLGATNDFALFFSDGAGTAPGDWAAVLVASP